MPSAKLALNGNPLNALLVTSSCPRSCNAKKKQIFKFETQRIQFTLSYET